MLQAEQHPTTRLGIMGRRSMAAPSPDRRGHAPCGRPPCTTNAAVLGLPARGASGALGAAAAVKVSAPPRPVGSGAAPSVLAEYACDLHDGRCARGVVPDESRDPHPVHHPDNTASGSRLFGPPPPRTHWERRQRFLPLRVPRYRTPSFFCRLDDEVVYCEHQALPG